MSSIGLSQEALDPLSLGHEWIESGKDYYRVDISEEGIYRISYEELLAAGMPVDSISGSQVELFSYGQRVAVRVSSSNRLQPGDFIEWYATPNDGTVDALLYNNAAEEQLNPKVSLYGRNRPYYISWTKGPFSVQYYAYRPNAGADNNPIVEQYYMHREEMIFDTFHYKPTHDGRNFIRYSSMDIGEGYGTKLAGERTIDIPVDHLSAVGIDPVLEMRFATNVLSRSWRISVNDRNVTTATTSGYDVVDLRQEIRLDDIRNGNVQVKITPLNNNNEKHTLASIALVYPRSYTFDRTDYIHYVQHPSLLGRQINIPNYQGTEPIAYNLQSGYYIYPKVTDGQLSMRIPQVSIPQDWVIADQATAIKGIDKIEKTILKKKVSSMDYLILSSSAMIESGAVEEYAAYRKSSEGGGYEVTVQNVEELYDLYSYGVKHHPLAIKNFMQDLREQDMLPKFVFLIGKGREYEEIREGAPADLVPTFGVPGSDNLLVAPRGQRYPDVAVGRLAAQSSEDIINYLSKIKDHELAAPGDQTIEDQGWKKRILHLSGGSADIQETIYRFLNNMGDVIENKTFAADVFTFRKRSADPIKAVATETIVSRINEGASVLTFFGHSAVGTFDFSLEDPSKYSNKGRNPVILSLGCHSGNIHTSTQGISEEFVLEPDNGAIAFIASSGTAYAEPQYLSGLYFYELLGEEMYGMPIGQVLQSSLQQRGESSSIAVQTLVEQMTLHGDPAYHYQTFEGPDYVIDDATVGVDPAIISTTSSYFTVSFDVVNIGALQNELVDVSVIHVLPDGSHGDTVITTLSAPGYKTSISLDINNPGDHAVGANRILINIDPQSKVSELPSQKAKANNNYMDPEGIEGLSFYIFDNSAKPIYPTNYGIIGDESVTLKASLSNGLVSSGKFIIELDTTSLFDSPTLIQEEIAATSSLISWTPDVQWTDETVYYWRIAPLLEDDSPLKSNQWRQSSFIYISGESPGWNQSHYYQHIDNQYTSVTLDPSSRRLGFVERTWDVRIKNELRQEQDFWVFVNNTPWASLNPKQLAPGLAIFIWDPGSVIFNNNGTDYGSLAFSKDVFIYKMDKLRDRRNIIQLLEDIPTGARVFMHTILGDATSDLHVEDWLSDSTVLGTTLYDVLEGYGATKVRELATRGTVPYTFVFDKGGEAVVEDIANNIEEVIDLSAKAKTNWDHGNVTSVDIGPAAQWGQLQWSESKSSEDQTNVTVYGINGLGEEVELMVLSDQYQADLSAFNAQQYRYLRLSYDTRDDVLKTSANLDHWRVIYDALPDAAIYTDLSSTIMDTIDAGALLDINYSLLNLSPVNMDGMIVRYALIDQRNGKAAKVVARRTSRLPGDGQLSISQSMSTDQLSGEYQLIIEVNPQLIVPEQSDCNNFGFKRIYVRPDERNPLLDVTFDDRRIRNGEIVKQRPEIVVSLEDQDSYLLLNDPDDFDITLYYPQVFVWQPDTSSIAAAWEPATTLEDNIARYILTPNLSLEGIYTLKVNAKDRAGNLSGDQHYQVTFEVREDEIPVVLSVGPNPTSDYVIFDYNLKTDRVPQIFDLFIYSTDGRLVDHATKEDFGGLKKGINTYRWQAQNSNGEILPSGLYFYEIINSFDSRKNKVKGSIFVLRP